MNSLEQRLAATLAILKEKGLQRSLSLVERVCGTHIVMQGRELVNFSSNDYLGLASHPALREAALMAQGRFGYGATASRLICGTTREHVLLEEELAACKKTEAALLFSSGFAAATGALPALLQRGDVVILDKLAHASLIDGARASDATVRVFRHNDLNHLEQHLCWARKHFPKGEILIVTESLFSMDGDVAPLQEMVELKERYSALLFVDEAHAIGVRGKAGQRMGGLVGEFGLVDRVDIQMGTLGKAVGASGGYLCGSRCLIDYLLHRARSFIYTTAMPASVAAAARAGVRIINDAEGEALATSLWKNIHQLSHCLSKNLPQQPTGAILPLILGTEERALEVSRQLLATGFFVPAIRYPTVPRGTARLRITISAAHTLGQINEIGLALS